MAESKDQIAASFQSVILERDLVDGEGKVVAKKGERVILSPQVLDKTVFMADGRQLGAVLPELELVLAGYQTQLIKLSDRLTAAGVK